MARFFDIQRHTLYQTFTVAIIGAYSPCLPNTDLELGKVFLFLSRETTDFAERTPPPPSWLFQSTTHANLAENRRAVNTKFRTCSDHRIVRNLLLNAT
jgi:hypothetical protein